MVFSSGGSHPVRLEGMLHPVDGVGPWPAAIICHPHPLGGGTMNNTLVLAMARALASRGVIALRFNFRGVGGSGGEHDNGRAERADVAGALDWLSGQPGVDPRRVSLVGYSFGAWVGLSLAENDTRPAATAAVGLAAWHYDSEFYQGRARFGLDIEPWQFRLDFLQEYTRPKLFIAGEHDPIAPPAAVRRLVDRVPEPKTLHVVRGADHSFRGCEQIVGDLVGDVLAAL